MNREQVKGQWNQMKGSVRKQWGKLTEDDLETIAGGRERLAGKVQERYGISKEEAERQIANFDRALHPPSADSTAEYKRRAG
jgi:uncharacterized protein YjbJ (UPF0337 family)